jgi:Xaa-Pro dipeptidase
MEIPFSLQEYRNRLTRVRQIMDREQIDLIYVTSPESLYYLSGYQNEWYQAQSPSVWPAVSGIAVHVDHDRFIFFELEEEAILSRYQTVSTDTRHFPRVRQTSAIDFLVNELSAEKWLSGTVGLEMRSYRPNRAISEQFQAAFERAETRVVDATDVVREARTVKSPAEMQCTATAMRIADIGMRAAMETARPGLTELEVYAEMIAAMARAGGENPGITLPVLSGPKSASPHGLASRKTIMPGENVIIDVCGVYNRYHANVARTMFMGEPPKSVLEMHEKSAGSFEVLREILRPGLPFADLNQAVVRYYQETGIWGENRWVGGYDLGIGFPPDWVGPFVYDPNLDPGDRALVPGTVVNYESQYYLPHGLGITFLIDTIAVDEHEARLLSTIPYELVIVE